jgi:hypothetical protein
MASTIDKLFAAKLAKAKMATKEKPHFFALVLKGGTSGKLQVDRKKIPTLKIGALKKATGGSAVVIGICYFDKQAGALIFETAKPPGGTWAKVVKDMPRKEGGRHGRPRHREKNRLPGQVRRLRAFCATVSIASRGKSPRAMTTDVRPSGRRRTSRPSFHASPPRQVACIRQRLAQRRPDLSPA